jgi:hypothetical protein
MSTQERAPVGQKARVASRLPGRAAYSVRSAETAGLEAWAYPAHLAEVAERGGLHPARSAGVAGAVVRSERAAYQRTGTRRQQEWTTVACEIS